MAKVPSISRSVHYVAPGSADGRFAPAHRAGTVTEDPVRQDDGTYKVNLCVLNPQGIHWPVGVPYDPTGTRPYSWHWPEYVPDDDSE